MTRTIKSGNLTAVAVLMDFVNESERNAPSAAVQSSIAQHWEKCGSCSVRQQA
jgi:hypothetical protein